MVLPARRRAPTQLVVTSSEKPGSLRQHRDQLWLGLAASGGRPRDARGTQLVREALRSSRGPEVISFPTHPKAYRRSLGPAWALGPLSPGVRNRRRVHAARSRSPYEPGSLLKPFSRNSFVPFLATALNRRRVSWDLSVPLTGQTALLEGCRNAKRERLRLVPPRPGPLGHIDQVVTSGWAGSLTSYRKKRIRDRNGVSHIGEPIGIWQDNRRREELVATHFREGLKRPSNVSQPKDVCHTVTASRQRSHQPLIPVFEIGIRCPSPPAVCVNLAVSGECRKEDQGRWSRSENSTIARPSAPFWALASLGVLLPSAKFTTRLAPRKHRAPNAGSVTSPWSMARRNIAETRNRNACEPRERLPRSAARPASASPLPRLGLRLQRSQPACHRHAHFVASTYIDITSRLGSLTSRASSAIELTPYRHRSTSLNPAVINTRSMVSTSYRNW